MHRRGPRRGYFAGFNKNISGTIFNANIVNSGLERGAEEGCVFIAPARWLAGKPPFCGRPTAPNSPYCPHHAALCRVPAKESIR